MKDEIVLVKTKVDKGDSFACKLCHYKGRCEDDIIIQCKSGYNYQLKEDV